MQIPMVLMNTNKGRAGSSAAVSPAMKAYLGRAGIATVLKDRLQREFPIPISALLKTMFQRTLRRRFGLASGNKLHYACAAAWGVSLPPPLGAALSKGLKRNAISRYRHPWRELL